MYAYIKGKVTLIHPSNVVIECNNIGYLIFMPNPYSLKLDEEVMIHLYQK